jgi:hypothetical protein
MNTARLNVADGVNITLNCIDESRSETMPELTIEAANQILTEHDAFQSYWLSPEICIALAQGILDRRELAALRLAVEPVAEAFRKVPDSDGPTTFITYIDSAAVTVTVGEFLPFQRRALLAAVDKEGNNG